MARALALAVAAILAAWLLVDFLFRSDAERVEAIVERMAVLAREGGAGAADELRGYVAPDLVSDVPLDRLLQRWVVPGAIGKVELGGFQTVPTGDAIVVPILRVDVTTKDRRVYTGVRALTFEERDGRWLLARISRVKFGG